MKMKRFTSKVWETLRGRKIGTRTYGLEKSTPLGFWRFFRRHLPAMTDGDTLKAVVEGDFYLDKGGAADCTGQLSVRGLSLAHSCTSLNGSPARSN